MLNWDNNVETSIKLKEILNKFFTSQIAACSSNRKSIKQLVKWMLHFYKAIIIIFNSRTTHIRNILGLRASSVNDMWSEKPCWVNLLAWKATNLNIDSIISSFSAWLTHDIYKPFAKLTFMYADCHSFFLLVSLSIFMLLTAALDRTKCIPAMDVSCLQI